MIRNTSIQSPNRNHIEVQKKRVAYHEAGHAVAIIINNELKQLPPVFFNITINDFFQSETFERHQGSTTGKKYSAKVDGGRLIRSLPKSIDRRINTEDPRLEKHENNCIEFLKAVEADIINLLIGPLAEAKHVAHSDGEVFNQYLINVEALRNYGGASDLALIVEYLQCVSCSKNLLDHKLKELHLQAFDFVDNTANWKRIMKLADYIIDGNLKTIDSNEIKTVLNKHNFH